MGVRRWSDSPPIRPGGSHSFGVMGCSWQHTIEFESELVDMTETQQPSRVLLIDDLRCFLDGRPAEVARTSAAGVQLLQRHRGQWVDELWLDHDLGGEDTIWPVVEMLERAAFDGEPWDIGVVFVHSANPAGAAKIVQALSRWRYNVRPTSGSPHVGYPADRSRPV